MLHERTGSAFARSFKRIVQLAVVGLALAGLAACGGGGGSSTPAEKTPATPAPTPTPDPAPTPTPAPTPPVTTPTPPEIPITPTPTELPPPTEAELAAATVVTPGETVTGTLESGENVKYYRLVLTDADDRTLVFPLELTLDAETGTEVALLDSSGRVVLASATTASRGKILINVAINVGLLFLPGGQPVAVTRGALLIYRVVRAVNSTKAVRYSVKAVKVAAATKTAINLIRGIPRVELYYGVGMIDVDLSGIFGSDSPLVYKLSGSIGSFSAKVEGQQLHSDIFCKGTPGRHTFTVSATHPSVANINTIAGGKLVVPYEVVVIDGGPKAMDSGVLRATIAEGGTFTSQPVADLFCHSTEREPTYSADSLRGSSVKGWHYRIENGRLVVETTSDRRSDDNNIDIDVVIADAKGRTASTRFSIFTTEAGEMPATPPASGTQPATPPGADTPPAEQPGGQQPPGGEMPAMSPGGAIPTDEAICRTITIGYREGDPETGASPAEFCRTATRELGLAGQVLPGGTPLINCCNLL